MAITSYATLKTAIESWLMRSDIDAATLVQLAESEFRDDHRLRKLADAGEYDITAYDADDLQLPTDFLSLESWRHNGPTYYHKIEVVPDADIGRLRSEYSPGAPRFVAMIDGLARFAPEPNATFVTRMLYWATIDPLSDSNTSNWLLQDHPLIYLYGALKHSAPFLKEDERVAVWKALFDELAERRGEAVQRSQFAGPIRVRARRAIGG